MFQMMITIRMRTTVDIATTRQLIVMMISSYNIMILMMNMMAMIIIDNMITNTIDNSTCLHWYDDHLHLKVSANVWRPVMWRASLNILSHKHLHCCLISLYYLIMSSKPPFDCPSTWSIVLFIFIFFILIMVFLFPTSRSSWSWIFEQSSSSDFRIWPRCDQLRSEHIELLFERYRYKYNKKENIY